MKLALARRLPRSYLVRLAQLVALWAYSVSQPVFSMLEGNREFFVLRDAGLLETSVFAFLLAFGVPLITIAYIRVAALLSAWVADVLFVTALAVFAVPLAFQAVKLVDPALIPAVLVALALCALAVACYVRWRAVRLFLTFSVSVPIAGLALFLEVVPTAADEAQAARVHIDTPAPVVFVLFDEFPASSLLTRRGAIDGVRYPAFGQLARDGTWYPNATTVHAKTERAVPAILTGRMPVGGTLPTVADHPDNLFTLLGEAYSFEVQEPLTRLCPANYCPRDEGSLLGRVDQLVADARPAYVLRILPRSLMGIPRGALPMDRRFERVTYGADEDFKTFLSGLDRNETSPTLYFLHSLFPHHPWRFLPSGRTYGPASHAVWIDASQTLLADQWLARQALQRHLLQVDYADVLLGRVLRRLHRLGLYDRALIVVVADHGASFRPGYPLRLPEVANFAGIASVPLLVKYPGQARGRVDRRAARTIDVLPTIADVLGLRLPWRVDGTSLLRRPPSRDDAVIVDDKGSDLRVSMRTLERQNDALARRNAAWFGEGKDSLFAVGMHRKLLGMRVEEGVPTSRSVHVHVENGSGLLNVRKSSGYVPLVIQGVVDDGRIEDSVELAIAVNGRVRALTRPFFDGRTQVFHALVPETALRDGSNRVDIYAIEETAGGIVLRALGGNR